jgi:hypothetical protein
MDEAGGLSDGLPTGRDLLSQTRRQLQGCPRRLCYVQGARQVFELRIGEPRSVGRMGRHHGPGAPQTQAPVEALGRGDWHAGLLNNGGSIGPHQACPDCKPDAYLQSLVECGGQGRTPARQTQRHPSAASQQSAAFRFRLSYSADEAAFLAEVVSLLSVGFTPQIEGSRFYPGPDCPHSPCDQEENDDHDRHACLDLYAQPSLDLFVVHGGVIGTAT